MADARPTIDDVAREAGVAKSTVSAVLNGKSGVGDATRARITAIIERLGYRPGVAAAVRRPARDGATIGLVIKEIDNPYYLEIAAAAIAEGRTQHATVLVASSEGDPTAERDAVRRLCDQGVDGLIVTPVLDPGADLGHLFDLRRRNFPFVLLEEVRGVRASLVDIENVEASRRAVEHLLALGHVRIAHLAGPEYSMHSRERIEGVHRAFAGTPHALPADAIVRAGAHLEDGHRAGLALFSGADAARRPTAVTCYNDLVALGLLRALRDLGLSVPRDVSVIGFEDLRLLDWLDAPLDSVHVPTADMGRRATALLLRQLAQRAPAEPVREILEGRLVLRGSSAPPGDAAPAPARAPRRTPRGVR